jgi:hypothetical protein
MAIVWEDFYVWITVGLAVLAALLLAIGIWWLWWRLPKREAARLALKIRDAKARVDVEDTYRKTIGQALGGIVVLLGAGFAYLQFLQQQRAAHDLLISNQVSKGFELLGNKDKDAVILRLGGIYALEGVMNNTDQYHQAVLEALSAFVRSEHGDVERTVHREHKRIEAKIDGKAGNTYIPGTDRKHAESVRPTLLGTKPGPCGKTSGSSSVGGVLCCMVRCAA